MISAGLDWEKIEDAIFSWFSESTGLDVVWANHQRTQLKYPFGTLGIIAGPDKEGEDEVRWSSHPDGIIRSVVGWRTVTLSCQVFVDEASAQGRQQRDAREAISAAQVALERHVYADRFRAANIAPIGGQNIINLSLISGTDYVARFGMDVTFRLASCVTESVVYDTVDSVEIDGEISGVDVTITVP